MKADDAPGGHVTLIAGRPLAVGDPLGVLIGEGVAHSMKLAPGDVVTLLVNTPGGALNTLEFHVNGIFRTFSKDFDDRAVRVPIAAARELLAIKGAHSVIVSLKETASTASVYSKLNDALAARDYEVKTWLELDDFYPKTVALYKRQFGILQLIILAIVMLTVANSVNMTAYERQGGCRDHSRTWRAASATFPKNHAGKPLIGNGGYGVGTRMRDVAWHVDLGRRNNHAAATQFERRLHRSDSTRAVGDDRRRSDRNWRDLGRVRAGRDTGFQDADRRGVAREPVKSMS